ncbi:MAG: hypothetical protein IT371_09520 [Deltaproteobacteria bacterium]|nr:hypothetical protein [Deltaproteobacteria bacterium]
MTWLAVLTVALVAQDQTPLLAAAEERAPRQATLWPGDWLEVRGARRDYLQVYDHRHERPGYVHRRLVRAYEATEAAAPRLRAVIEFLREQAGGEALGIGYVALYLKVAPRSALDAEVFSALGTFAQRLAYRASAERTKRGQDSLGAHLDVARSYGVRLASFESDGRTRTCYDGEAFRRVLAFKAPPELKARAALAVTDPACVHPELGPRERRTVLEWSAALLDKVDPLALPAYLGNRLRLRSARVAAELAFELARAGDRAAGAKRAEAALASLLRVDRRELAEADLFAYEETRVQVGTSRYLRGARASRPGRGLALRLEPRGPGETCVRLYARGRTNAKAAAPLVERCTHGLVHAASARVAPRGERLVLAVQPLAGWLELWVFQRGEKGFQVDVVVPATTEPRLGYVELAGFSPDGGRLLLAREVVAGRRWERRFEVLEVATLAVKEQGAMLRRVPTFRRWFSPEWRGQTLALR